MKLPSQIGPIHFVGVGGIGMSGIAEVLLNLGHQVQGSDLSDNANVKRLRELGAKVFVGHDKANLGQAAVAVVSSAVKRDNPEVVAARAELGQHRPGPRGDPADGLRVGVGFQPAVHRAGLLPCIRGASSRGSATGHQRWSAARQSRAANMMPG